MSPQSPPIHAAAPLGSVGQFTQLVPQPVGSLSAAQRAPVPVPQTCVPTPQVKPHVVPSQLVDVAPAGTEQDVHDVAPQLPTLVLLAQMPEQSWVPLGQTPLHEALDAMQVPAHSFMLVGQAGLHCVPSQVTEPPVGCTQALHDEVPQLPTSLLLTHLPPHRWYPVAHDNAQLPPTHCATPWGSVGQAVHDIPHAVASLSSAQPAPHL
jgi:hypothetical protein